MRVVEWTNRPKIIVPIVGRSPSEIDSVLPIIAESAAEIVEWRIDHFQSFAQDAVLAQLENISARVGNRPVLCTIRTIAEGGRADLSDSEYLSLIETLGSSKTDLIDVEFRHPLALDAITAARRSGTQVVVSHHDLTGQLDGAELATLLTEMAMVGDVPKVAVNPVDEIQVAELLLASAKYSAHKTKPFILLAMGALGGVTRFTGELFGSCATFATLTESSAPGQLSVSQTVTGLDLISDSLHG